MALTWEQAPAHSVSQIGHLKLLDSSFPPFNPASLPHSGFARVKAMLEKLFQLRGITSYDGTTTDVTHGQRHPLLFLREEF